MKELSATQPPTKHKKAGLFGLCDANSWQSPQKGCSSGDSLSCPCNLPAQEANRLRQLGGAGSLSSYADSARDHSEQPLFGLGWELRATSQWSLRRSANLAWCQLNLAARLLSLAWPGPPRTARNDRRRQVLRSTDRT